MIISFILDVHNYRGGPNIKISVNDLCVFDKQLKKKGINQLDLDVNDFKLPGKIVIEQYGKNMNKDTKVNPVGGILDDKGVSILSVKLGQCELKYEIYLFKFYKQDGEILQNINYLGYNGSFVIPIDDENVNKWKQSLQKYMLKTIDDFDYNKFKQEIFSEGPNLVVNYD